MYIRMFNTEKVIKKTIKQSKYFPYPMRDAFKKLKDQRDLFIICPIFSNEEFQVGITGKMEENETIKDCVIREVGEEVGLVPDKIDFINDYIWKGSITFFIYNIDIKNCRNVIDCSSKSKFEDIKHKKVGCFIYGEEEEVYSYLKSKISVYKNNDDIIGIAGVKISDIKMFI